MIKVASDDTDDDYVNDDDDEKFTTSRTDMSEVECKSAEI